MTKKTVLIVGLLVLGVAGGVSLIYDRDDAQPQPASDESHWNDAAPAASVKHPMADAFVIAQASDDARIEALEQQVLALQMRVEQLEHGLEDDHAQVESDTAAALPRTGQSTVDTPVSSLNPAVTTSNLIKAGIDAEIAADIVRRRNEIDMKLLELRDRAAREGFYGTERYLREASELREQSPSLRDELGDDSYDRYLFTSRQTNRVKAVSVMMGSPAEMSGMQAGDLILSYDNRKIFNFSELQEATSRGERGEYVNVTVRRNGQLNTLWVPRGPLGIRLGAARMKP